MTVKKNETIEYIINRIPSEYIKHPTRMNQRKLIKLIINEYSKVIYDTIVSDRKFVITNIGRFEPVNFRIGAKINPFTAKPVVGRIIKRIKFVPSIKLRNRVKELLCR